MNLVDFVFRAAHALDRWSEPAIICEDGQITYRELVHLVKRCGGMIQQLDIQPGDRVAIVASDCPAFIVAFLGTVGVGSVAVPISTMLAPVEVEYILRHCGAKAAVVTSEQVEKLQSVRNGLPELENILLVDGHEHGTATFSDAISRSNEVEIKSLSDDTLAFILYTSGSTGQPKGAMHFHRNLRYTVETYCKHILQVRPGHRLFSSSRLFFAYGLGNSLSFPLSSGATTILCKERPTPPVIAEVFRRCRPTIFFGVPAVFRAVIEYITQGNSLDTASIDFCVSAGEKLPEPILREWKKLTGLDILDGIGSTEMLHMFMSNRRERIKPGSSGWPIPGYETKLVDPSGNEIVGPGTGDLLVKGLSASPGYWKNPEKTAATMVGEWICTGDLYRRDEEGDYWFEGRSDDLFKVKGLWVSPVEVEDPLCQQ